MSPGDPQIQTTLDAAQKSIRDALAAALDPAASALKAQTRNASQAERAVLTQAATQLVQSRQPLLAAFEKALREGIDEDVAPKDADPGFRDPTDWKAIGLVGEDQVEERLAFERVAQFISHECEAELRELAAYTGELLDIGWADPTRNPLRGNIVGIALSQAIESVVDNAETRRVLVKELGQALAKALPAAYRSIIDHFASRGLRQVDMAVRITPSAGAGGRGAGGGGTVAGIEAMRDLWEKSMLGRMPAGTDPAVAAELSFRSLNGGRFDAMAGAPVASGSAALLERLLQSALAGASWPEASGDAGAAPAGPGPAPGATDADLMRLLRRLSGPTLVEPLPDFGLAPRASRGPSPAAAYLPAAAPAAATSDDGGPTMPANLIRAHHDELVQASPGQMDHMVIEVVASLFDQILADARVPPQIAREIARLQLPVLRVALRDPSFFSSRKHAVRRLINRISALASGFGELETERGKELLDRVNRLVTEIVDGDFDQVTLYARKLGELEQFIAAKARADFENSPAAATLQAKEVEWQQARRFSGRLQEAVEPLPVPPYLKEFLADVWSRAIVAAAHGDAADVEREKRYRRAAFDLVTSIQPKRSVEQRSQFLASLRGLTATLDEGLARIGWPKQEHDAFFGRLIADHSGSLKAAPGSELDHNMLLRQADAAARTPLPDVADAGTATAELAELPFEPRFSPREARRIGLLTEDAIDWPVPAAPRPGSGIELDLDLATRPAMLDELPPLAASADAAAASGASGAPGAQTADAEEPTEGPRLREHLQVGSLYRLQLKTQWETVRLTHMNASRTFFLFTHGAEDRGTISMTARMLGRLCEAHRLKALEDKPLIDRATDRMRGAVATPLRTTPSRPQELSPA